MNDTRDHSHEEKTQEKALNNMSVGKLPGLLGIVIKRVSDTEIHSEIEIKEHHMAPNGYLHAGCLVTLADTSCGYGCRRHLPESAIGFTTIELKSNHLSTAKDGVIDCIARPLHTGASTQVWDAKVTHRHTNKVLALFRCTQMVLYPKQP